MLRRGRGGRLAPKANGSPLVHQGFQKWGSVMKKSAGLFVGLLVPAFMLAGAIANPAMAQEKAKAAPLKIELKVLLENDKVRVYEARAKPGAEGENIARPFRVIRALRGGTIMRTYADGKTEKIEWKTGDVRGVGPDPVFTPKNVGNSEILLYIVQPK